MILRRYMIQQIASTTAIVLGFLVFLLLGGRLIRYFGIAAEGKLDVSLLFSIIGYNLPYFLELILPLSFFVALMLVFGRLYVDHEMAVINGSGVSRGKLARLATPLILVLFFFEAGLSLVGKPWGVRKADSIWKEQALQSAFDLIRPNEFLSSSRYHLYVSSLKTDANGKTQLQNVVLIQTNTSEEKNTHVKNSKDNNTVNKQATNQQKKYTSQNPDELKNLPPLPTPTNIKKNLASKDTIVLAKMAQQVPINPNSGIAQLDLFNGRRYEIGANSLKYNQVGFERYRITLNQQQKDTVDETNIETQTITTIWKTVVNSTSSTPNLPAQAELGYRLALPWLIILAPMFAVPLSQVRPRQGRWIKLIPAILVFVCVALGIISLKKPVSEGKVTAWVNLWLIVGFMIGALYLNWAGRINQRIRYKHANKLLQSQHNYRQKEEC